ncbi:hypothetical protein MHYP_G00328490 [Metynnis hypsauchen]
MKFAEHLSAHITPEWRKQYIQYEAFKEMLYAAQDQAPSVEVLALAPFHPPTTAPKQLFHVDVQTEDEPDGGMRREEQRI